MPARSTPSPELTPDESPPVNGSVNHVDSPATTILLGCPTEPTVDLGAAAPAVEPPASDQPVGAETSGKPDAQRSNQPSGAPSSNERPKPRRAMLETRKLAAGTVRVLERRGARSTVLGIALVAIGIALGATSAVAVALLIVGVLMLIVGLLGRRIEGRFAIEFGADGASIELQAHIASPGHTQLVAPLAPWEPSCAPIAQEPVRAVVVVPTEA